MLRLALISFVVLSTAGLLHDHDSVAQDLSCGVCHAVAHSSPAAPPAELRVAPASLLGVLVWAPTQRSTAARTSAFLRPRLRAPPPLLSV